MHRSLVRPRWCVDYKVTYSVATNIASSQEELEYFGQHRSTRQLVDGTILDLEMTTEILYDSGIRQPSQNIMGAYNHKPYRDRNCSSNFIDIPADRLPNYRVSQSSPAGGSGDWVHADDDMDLTPMSLDPLGPIKYPDTVADNETDSASKQSCWSDRIMPSGSAVVIIEHSPGHNDFATGAVMCDQVPLQTPIDDHLDCSSDLESQLNYMPWRILTVDSLAAIDGLFQNPDKCKEILPKNFLTINAGLARVIQEVRSVLMEGYDTDTLVLGALAKRGGFTAMSPRGPCVHPEDIESLIPSDHSFYDKEYWDVINSYGTCFENEIFRPVCEYIAAQDALRAARNGR